MQLKARISPGRHAGSRWAQHAQLQGSKPAHKFGNGIMRRHSAITRNFRRRAKERRKFPKQGSRE